MTNFFPLNVTVFVNVTMQYFSLFTLKKLNGNEPSCTCKRGF